MKLARRILTTVAVTLAVIYVSLNWVGPVALSFYAAKKALPVARVVPTDLKDHSVSETPGVRMSYFGYAFEVPWSDLDESKTQLYPKDKSNKTMVSLTFRSGLRLVVTAIPAKEWANGFAKDFKLSPQQFESFAGRGAAASDYDFVKRLYEFTPDRMHYWALSPGVHFRDQMVLMIKSIAPSKAAETGIFNVQNQSYKGFQQGNPEVRQNFLLLDLYSDTGSIEIKLLQKGLPGWRYPT